MDDAPLKVGVVGVGYLGHFHVEKYAHLKGAELVGVTDLDQSRAVDVARALGAAAFADYRELFSQVEAVSVAVPTSSHFGVVQEALTAGCHVLVEKPISVTVAEADQLVRLARQRRLTLMVGHLERFNSAMEELKAKVTRPRFIESHRLAFFKERGTDVDVVLDLMIHDLDHILNLTSSPVIEIRAAGISVLTDRIDLANARLEFADGCIANLTASRMSFKSMRKFRLFQDDAYLAVDFENRELTIANKKADAVGPIPGVALQTRRFNKEDVLNKEIVAFIKSIKGGQEAPVTGEAGRAALNLALEIMAAMKMAKG